MLRTADVSGFAAASGWDVVLEAPLAAAVLTSEGRAIAINSRMLGLLRLGTVAAQHPGALSLLMPAPGWLNHAAESVTIHERRIVVPTPTGVRDISLAQAEVRIGSGNERGILVVAVPGVAMARSVFGAQRGVRELVDEAPFVVVRLDPASGVILLVSRAIEAWSGLPSEAFAADPALYRSLIVESDRPRFDELLEEVRAGAGASAVLELGLPGGDRRAAEHQLWPVLDGSGRIRVIEGTVRDVSARHMVQLLRDRVLDRVRDEQLRSELLANVSHELRTPLVSIAGYTELLLREAHGPLTVKQRRDLEVIENNSRRLGQLIERLLALREADAGRMALDMMQFDVRLALGEAFAMHRGAMKQKHLAIEVDLGNEQTDIRGDRPSLIEAFSAIIENAVKFSEPNGRVSVQLRRLATVVEVTVRDTGIGIPEAERRRVFERVYQVDRSPTRRFAGAGLGLALAKEQLARHGGSIVIADAEGGGTVVTVRLPSDTGLTDSDPGPRPRSERLLVLVAADPDRWPTLRGLFEHPGLEEVDILWASSEADVVRRARRYRPDGVVLGLHGCARAYAELAPEFEAQGVPIAVLDSSEIAPLVPPDRRLSLDAPDELVLRLRQLLGSGEPMARVVVVEDEMEIADFARFLLEREGHSVECVSTGEAAFEKIDSRCDLVVLDLALLDVDGIDVCRRLTEELPNVPVIVMTAMSGNEVRRMALDAGAVDFLLKPFSVETFLSKVREHLRRHHARMAAGSLHGSKIA